MTSPAEHHEGNGGNMVDKHLPKILPLHINELGDVPDPSFIPHQCDARDVNESVESPSPACFTELVKGGHSASVSPNPPLHCPQLKPSLLCNGHTVGEPVSLCVQYRRIISAGLWLPM